MKRKFEHPAPSERELTGPKYWRSLDELAATPGFRAQLEREFPQGAAELDGVDRRHFLKIMSASFALAARSPTCSLILAAVPASDELLPSLNWLSIAVSFVFRRGG